MKYNPVECGELKHYDLALSSMDSIDAKRILIKKSAQGENGITAVGFIPFNELTVLDSVISECFNAKGNPLDNRKAKFYMEFITGYYEKQNQSFKIYGVVNSILFLDRVIGKLLMINPKFEIINSLKLDQQILINDRLCKCDEPY